MPLYCYQLPDGRVVDAVRPISRRNEPLMVDGEKAVRCLQAERPYLATARADRGPYIGQRGGRESLSVNPNQVTAMNNLLKRRGCKPARFDKSGICYPEDSSHTRSIMEARGMVDNSPSGNGLRVPGDRVAQTVVDNV